MHCSTRLLPDTHRLDGLLLPNIEANQLCSRLLNHIVRAGVRTLLPIWHITHTRHRQHQFRMTVPTTRLSISATPLTKSPFTDRNGRRPQIRPTHTISARHRLATATRGVGTAMARPERNTVCPATVAVLTPKRRRPSRRVHDGIRSTQSILPCLTSRNSRCSRRPGEARGL